MGVEEGRGGEREFSFPLRLLSWQDISQEAAQLQVREGGGHQGNGNGGIRTCFDNFIKYLVRLI